MTGGVRHAERLRDRHQRLRQGGAAGQRARGVGGGGQGVLLHVEDGTSQSAQTRGDGRSVRGCQVRRCRGAWVDTRALVELCAFEETTRTCNSPARMLPQTSLKPFLGFFVDFGAKIKGLVHLSEITVSEITPRA